MKRKPNKEKLYKDLTHKPSTKKYTINKSLQIDLV